MRSATLLSVPLGVAVGILCSYYSMHPIRFGLAFVIYLIWIKIMLSLSDRINSIFTSLRLQIYATIIRSLLTTISVCLVQIAAGKEAPGFILHTITIWMGVLFASRETGLNQLIVFVGGSKIIFCVITLYYMGNSFKEITSATFILCITAVMSQFYKKYMNHLMELERTKPTNKEVDRMIRVYRDLYQFAPVVFMSLSVNSHCVVNYNIKGTELFGDALSPGVYFPTLFCGEYSKQILDMLNLYSNDAGYIQIKNQDKYVSVCVSLLDDNETGISLLHVILVDVTESRQAQVNVNNLNVKLTEAKDNAEKSNLDKSRFLAITSHELRTPLHGVICSCDLLNDTKMDDDQFKLVEVINNCSTILVDLINKIMDFSKIEADAMELENQKFDLLNTLDCVCVGLSAKATKRRVHLDKIVNIDVPRYVSGDSTRLSQILINLVGNALKFTEPNGQVLVSVCLYKESCDGKHFVKFVVKDTGIGIPAWSIPNLFNDFSQVDTSTTRKFGGTGLGLAISKRIADLMHGDIAIESEEGIGSTFTFTCVLQEIKHQEEEKSQKVVCEDTCNDHDLSHLRVLVAEDSSINRAVMKRMLNKLGVTDITMAVDGEKAVDAYKRERFDIILMDGSMPIQDGYTASRLIREYEVKQNMASTPIIAVTANATEHLVQMCHDAGMTSYLTKPLIVKDLKIGMTKALKLFERCNCDKVIDNIPVQRSEHL